MARREASRAGQLLSRVKGRRDYGGEHTDASGDDVDASCGPGGVLWTVWARHGQVLRTCPPLAHTRRPRAHILTAAATTIHGKGNTIGSDRFPDCSVIPGNPSTEQTGQFPRGFHEEMRETILTLRDDGQIVLFSEFGDDSSLLDDIRERPNGVFEKVGSPYGDKYRIVPSDGNLQLIDNDGLIRVASRLENTPRQGECR